MGMAAKLPNTESTYLPTELIVTTSHVSISAQIGSVVTDVAVAAVMEGE